MIKNIYIYTVIAAFCTWSCNDPQVEREEKVNSNDKEQVHSSAGAEDHPHEMSELRLNNGEKWQANEATTTAIANMLGQVNIYQATEGDERNVQNLQTELNKEFKLLVERCTMKGEAHEQLHHYILPLKTFIDELDEGNQDKNVQVVKTYLLKYEEYFV